MNSLGCHQVSQYQPIVKDNGTNRIFIRFLIRKSHFTVKQRSREKVIFICDAGIQTHTKQFAGAGQQLPTSPSSGLPESEDKYHNHGDVTINQTFTF